MAIYKVAGLFGSVPLNLGPTRFAVKVYRRWPLSPLQVASMTVLDTTPNPPTVAHHCNDKGSARKVPAYRLKVHFFYTDYSLQLKKFSLSMTQNCSTKTAKQPSDCWLRNYAYKWNKQRHVHFSKLLSNSP